MSLEDAPRLFIATFLPFVSFAMFAPFKRSWKSSLYFSPMYFGSSREAKTYLQAAVY